MKQNARILIFLCIVFFLVGKGLIVAQVQSLTFNWNGTIVYVAGYPNYYNGSIQRWAVPNCVTSLTIEVLAGTGGGITLNNNLGAGGAGAAVSGVIPVTPGHVLKIIAGGQGACGTGGNGGGGGGGSFVWDSNSNSLLVAAGGGGGKANGDSPGDGERYLAHFESPTPDQNNSCGAGGSGGNGGAAGSYNMGSACGGAGWYSNGGLVAAGPYYYTGYGIYPENNINPGYGGLPYNWNVNSGTGGYGGGSGGGHIGGGGGGGYNGGGGGGQYSGGGGGSFFMDTVPPSTGGDGPLVNGYVNIRWHPPLMVNVSVTPAVCSNTCNGVATANVSGGVSPFTYSWSPTRQTNDTASGLCAGTYTVSVQDSRGCNCSASIIIIQSPVVLASMQGTPVEVNCYGGSNGSAAVTAVGGVSPYSYSWSPTGGTYARAIGLRAGTYTATVNDSNGCTATASVIITQPNQLAVITQSLSAISCHGGSNGSATLTASGGTSPYSYSWSPHGGNRDTATGLSAGIYTVTVTDANGCSISASISITQPTALVVGSRSLSAISCNGGSNGAAIASPSGGTSPYIYSWSPVISSNDTIRDLSAGIYSVTVTDNNGCTASSSIGITQPIQLAVGSVQLAGVSCYGGSNGSAIASTSGGTSAYSYSWTPSGGTNAIGRGLSAGIYSVTVTDAHGCTATASVTITQATLLTVTASSTPASCNFATGSATASASGGISPYSYSWSPVINTTATITGLSAGTYTITVTDANSCTATANAIVNQSPSFTPLASVLSNVLCNGGTSGSATITVIGGFSPYTYSWSPNGGTNANATGLTVGTYTIAVTDASGCSVTTSVAITQPPPLGASIGAQTNILCNGINIGAATIAANGGTSPYSYSWSPIAGTNATLTGLSAGIYSITVTDANSCTVSTSVSITQPTILTASMSVPLNVLCSGGSNGSATVTVNGGTPAYSYLWTPSGETIATATGLSAGNYTVIVTDANSCTVSSSATITEPTLLTATIASSVNVSCNGGYNGSATVTASGGTPNYSYSWAPTGGTNASATGLIAGNYTITVTDANSCTASASVNITQPEALTISANVLTNIVCNGGSGGSASATAGGGILPYTYFWTPNGGNNDTATGLTAGVYTVTLTDANQCTASARVIITQPIQLTVGSGQLAEVSCNGGSNGSVSVTASGGTSPYIYSWGPKASSNSSISGLSVGIYSVTVTDDNQCTSSTSVTITQPTPLALTLIGSKSICAGQQGTIIAGVTGGTSPYIYSWSSGATTNSITIQLSANKTFLCTVTDANGCTDTSSIAIELGPPLVVSISGPKSLCSGTSITLCGNASGGVGNKTFTWQPGNVKSSCINLSPKATTVYSLTVTDDCGANGVIIDTVFVNPSPQVNFTSNIQFGCIPFCLQFLDHSYITSGKEASWYWNFGDGDTANTQYPVYCYPNAGNFSVSLTIVSDSGCSATLQIKDMIGVYSNPIASFMETPQQTTLLNPAILFTNESTDQYGITNWLWNFEDGTTNSDILNPTHSYYDTGTYCVQLIVNNIHGCSDTATNCLIISPVFNLYIPSAFTPNGDGVNDIFQPKGTNIKSFDMYVFDRWGMQLFHSNDINMGWNGTVNRDGMHAVSTICQEDTYVYKIYAVDAQNNAHTYIGQVTLLK